MKTLYKVFVPSLIIFVIMLLELISSCYDQEEAQNYAAFENMVLTEENIKRLNEAFFPTNRRKSTVVNVTYYLLSNGNNTKDNASKINFRWLASPINLFINPDLLRELSLLSYIINVTNVDLNIETQCTHDELTDLLYKFQSTNETCVNISTPLTELLNNFTTNVRAANTIHCKMNELLPILNSPDMGVGPNLCYYYSTHFGNIGVQCWPHIAKPIQFRKKSAEGRVYIHNGSTSRTVCSRSSILLGGKML